MKKVVLLVFFVLPLLLFGCSSEKPTNDKKSFDKVKEEVYVTTSYKFIKDSSILVSVTNPIDKVVDINVDIKYFDKNDQELASDSKKIVAVHNLLEAKIEFDNVPIEAKTFGIEANYKKNNVVSFANIVDVSTFDNGKNISLEINNYTEDIIDNMLIGIIFLDNKQEVSYSETSINNVEVNKSMIIEIDYPVNKNMETIYFDEVKYVINNAYSK
ncbi:MAG: hypothetical protein ACK5NF_05805 [Bacilli bacterium]